MDAQTAINTVGSQLQEALPGATPGFIQALIAALMQVLGGGCFGPTPTPPAIKAACSAPTYRDGVALHIAMRENGIRPLSQLGQEATAAVWRLGATAGEDLVGGMLQASQA